MPWPRPSPVDATRGSAGHSAGRQHFLQTLHQRSVVCPAATDQQLGRALLRLLQRVDDAARGQFQQGALDIGGRQPRLLTRQVSFEPGQIEQFAPGAFRTARGEVGIAQQSLQQFLVQLTAGGPCAITIEGLAADLADPGVQQHIAGTTVEATYWLALLD